MSEMIKLNQTQLWLGASMGMAEDQLKDVDPLKVLIPANMEKQTAAVVQAIKDSGQELVDGPGLTQSIVQAMVAKWKKAGKDQEAIKSLYRAICNVIPIPTAAAVLALFEVEVAK